MLYKQVTVFPTDVKCFKIETLKVSYEMHS